MFNKHKKTRAIEEMLSLIELLVMSNVYSFKFIHHKALRANLKHPTNTVKSRPTMFRLVTLPIMVNLALKTKVA
jgi:hypothetical protein